MDYEGIAASARGEGLAYEKQKKAAMKKAEDAHWERIAAQKWKVTITIHRGTIHHSTDSNGLSDPYIDIYVGDFGSWRRIATTKVQSKTLNPVWEETFEATVSNCTSDIKLKLYDKDRFGSDSIGKWTSFARPTGVKDLPFASKKDEKVITANCDVTISWVLL